MVELTVPQGMAPVVITAELAGGIAIGAGWGIALDGLLASQLWAQHKAQLRAAGIATVPLLDQPDPEDLPLPLARCGSGENWHWAATCAAPNDQSSEHPRDVRTWTGRIDERICRQITAGTPGTLPTHHGRWRHRVMPVVVTLCRSVTWRAVGDPEQVAALLRPITAIGKKRSQGEGFVLTWDVQVDPDGDPVEHAHLHRDGSLGRPAPPACVPTGAHHAGIGRAGIRPPYTHRARQRELFRPDYLA